jgi:hypothetical protein
MSFYAEKVPDRYTPEAETCSPDGSVVAYYVPPGGSATTVMPKRLRKGAAIASNVDDKIQQLHDLQERQAKEEEKYKDNPTMLASVRRLFDRERRKILGNASE